ncbi:MAG TPA: PEP-CTERM sorting domain-containing protein [Planctomycetaceae bacterium]|nr:PEP-CTERM sorting domain-containing protein [Planctomycetaceae bacterium]
MTEKISWSGLAASCLMVALALGCAPAVSATPLDFEALTCQSSISSYEGFTFSPNWATECDADYAATWGNTSGAPSSVTAAGNTYAGDSSGVTISRVLPFNLLGGLASSFLVNDDFDFVTPQSSANLLIEGYLGGAFVGSASITFDPASGGVGTGYHSIGSLFGIDELRFFSSFDQGLTGGLDYWLVDNVDLADVDSAAPIPEPATLTLLGSALVAAALRRHRHTRNRVVR